MVSTETDLQAGETTQGLTDEQLAVATHKKGPLLVVAGPGSGKTHALTHRIAHLLNDNSAKPEEILAITFTRKAAGEMRERVANLSQPGTVVSNIFTFHGFGAKLLREHGALIGYDEGITIFDEADQLNLIKRAVADLNIGAESVAIRSVKEFISKYKNEAKSPEEVIASVEAYSEERNARIYQKYEELLFAAKGVDFDDLLLKTMQLLEQNKDLREHYQEQYKYILVDEFQDTNRIQLQLCMLVANRERNICAVGDPNQSIFAWRFAEIGNILNFQRLFPGTKIVYLSRSFRSTNNILDAANSLISHNGKTFAPVKMWSSKPKGENLWLNQSYDDEDEAEFVAQEILKLKRERGYNLNEMAIMYRTVAQSRAFEKSLARSNVPFRLADGVGFYERAEIKDMLAYLRLIVNPNDDIALLRAINRPRRGIGARKIEHIRLASIENNVGMSAVIASLLKEPLPAMHSDLVSGTTVRRFAQLISELEAVSRDLQPDELIQHIFDKCEYQAYLVKQDETKLHERLENIGELIGLAKQYRGDDALAATRALLSETLVDGEPDADSDKPIDLDGVTLTTIHRAKGLEYDVVFVVGMEEGLLPHSRSSGEQSEIEEERRLCYVAITRARELVYLTSASARASRRYEVAALSRFVGEIPERLISRSSAMNTAKNDIENPQTKTTKLASFIVKRERVQDADKPASNGSMAEFDVGEHAQHASYGKGVVVNVANLRSDCEVTLMFRDGERRKFMLSRTPLKKLPSKPKKANSKWRDIEYNEYDVSP